MTTLAKLGVAGTLAHRIETRTATVGVIGLGYVGLPLVLLFSEQGFPLTGFDVDPRKVVALENGKSYILRIEEADIQAAKKKGFHATADYSKISGMDAVIICVPTPLNEYHEPDLSYIDATARAIAPYLRDGQLIILESTTFPGTTEEVLIPLLEKGNPNGLRAARGNEEEQPNTFYVAFSPEREDPGNDTVDRRDVPKVVGGLNPKATRLACSLYESIFHTAVPVSGPGTAEMTKLLENIYRCINIALVNELKQLCLRMGIDIWEVIEAAKTKPFGFHAFYPGPGLGGHCIPIDPFYLSWKAKQYDFHTRFIELAGQINTAMPYFVVEKTAEALNERSKSIKGSKILVMGVAYKKDIDDLRESPSLTIIELLQKKGAVIDYHDPFIPRITSGRHYDLNMDSQELDSIEKYDCVIVVTDHSTVNYKQLVSKSQLVIDTRNACKGINAPNLVRC